MQKKKCDIIIPVWNEHAATAECIRSIKQHTAYPYKLILVDNGSDAETAGYLDSLKDDSALELELIRNAENLGFVKAVNQGIRASSAPYLCLVNNDTVATSGWLEEMISVMEADPAIGIVNPSSNTFGQEPRGGSIEEYAASLKQFSGKTQELFSARGFCMLVRRELINKIGLFDEAFTIGYFEETDFSCRAQKAGFRIIRAKGAYVYHKENLSFKILKDSRAIFSDNEKIFFKRWGRPVRIGYFVDRIDSGCRIEEIARMASRSGHQIFIFLKNGMQWPAGPDHINIRRVDVNPVFFGLSIIYSIFKRKKKKPLEVLITDNRFIGNVLARLEALHGSKVMISPAGNDLLRMLDKISKPV